MEFRDSLNRAKALCKAANVKPTVPDLITLATELEKDSGFDKALVEAKKYTKAMAISPSIPDLVLLAKKLAGK
jgi:hypothetical protein